MFKEITGFPDFIINEYGEVKGKSGHIRKQQINKKGYYKVCITKNNKKTHASIHRLVATTFIPNTLMKREVNHIDGNKKNNHVSNLEWIDQIDNIRLFLESKGMCIKKRKISISYLQLIINRLPEDYPIKNLISLL